jgi:TetR/AcrR family transcriptional regulator, mexJK operon transcriptional repressor
MAATRVYQRKTEDVLIAAEELFLRRGYADTSMQAVADHAGVAKATVYSNFPNKDALFEAVVVRRAECNKVDIDHIDLESGDVHATLVELATSFLLDIYSREQLELFRTVVADARRFPHLGKMMLEGPFLETHGKIREYFERLVRQGELTLTDPVMAVEYFLAIIKADKHVKLLFNQDVNIAPRMIRAIADGAVDIFLNGARPRRR